MLIIQWNEFLNNGLPLESGQSLSMTVGVFDGVHRGHKALIQKVVSPQLKDARNTGNLIPAAVVFREPAYKSERAAFIIQSFEEKAAVLETLGIEVLIVIDFTEEFSRMTGIEFLKTLTTHAAISFFAVGSNFRCGSGLDTDAEAVKEFFTGRGIPVEIVDEVLYEGEAVSSSRIREALEEGDLDLAEALINA